MNSAEEKLVISFEEGAIPSIFNTYITDNKQRSLLESRKCI